jgi:hypothetical protein
MIFAAGMFLFIVGKVIIEMNVSDFAFGDISTLAKGGVVLAIAGLVLILVSLSILAWRYLP